MTVNPYQAPAAELTSPEQSRGAAPALWNPNAVANWSLLFTPLFGAILISKNWQAMGEGKRASRARLWAYATPPFVIASGRGAWLILILWYFFSNRPQARYVSARWGAVYRRQPWGKPLGFVFLAWIGMILAFVAFYQLVSDPPMPRP